MIIQRKLDMAGCIIQGVRLGVDGRTYNCLISAESPLVLNAYLQGQFNPARHSLAAVLEWKESDFRLFLEYPNDIPTKNLYDPGNSLGWIIYEMEMKTVPVLRITDRDREKMQ